MASSAGPRTTPRARGEAGLMVTGGIAPNREGCPMEHGAMMISPEDVTEHRLVTDAVHAEGGRIAMQLLHFRRYANTPTLSRPVLGGPRSFLADPSLVMKARQVHSNRTNTCTGCNQACPVRRIVDGPDAVHRRTIARMEMNKASAQAAPPMVKGRAACRCRPLSTTGGGGVGVDPVDAKRVAFNH